jgi:hypothetical protein
MKYCKNKSEVNKRARYNKIVVLERNLFNKNNAMLDEEDEFYVEPEEEHVR